MNPKTEAIIKLGLLALFVALFLWWIKPVGKVSIEEQTISTGTSTLRMVTFPDTFVEARSAFVYDVREGKILYEKQSSLQMPLASLTKLMSALTASTLLPEYMLVPITTDDIMEEGDTGLYVDEKWNIQRLTDFTLLTSSNDGARALAGVAGAFLSSTSTEPIQTFVDEMNRMAKTIGLNETYFVNPSGLDVSKTLSGGYGSARDVAKLVAYIIEKKPRLVEATSKIKTVITSVDKNHQADNTNKAIAIIPNVIASKTGFTDLSQGNVVVAFNAGLDRPIIIAVLGSSYDGRFLDVASLASSTLSYIQNKAR